VTHFTLLVGLLQCTASDCSTNGASVASCQSRATSVNRCNDITYNDVTFPHEFLTASISALSLPLKIY